MEYKLTEEERALLIEAIKKDGERLKQGIPREITGIWWGYLPRTPEIERDIPAEDPET